MSHCDGFLDRNSVIDEIVSLLAIALQQEPWMRLPLSERVDQLTPLLASMIQVSGGADLGPERWAAMVRSAWEHGRRRAKQGFDERVILEEYYLVRRAVYQVFQRSMHMNALETIGRLDAVISSATLASLRGLHGIPHPTDSR